MRNLMMVMVASSLLFSAASNARTEPSGDTRGQDKLESARKAEMKGDLARIHNNYESAVSDYLEALHADRQNALLYNKLGIAELQLQERTAARKHFGQALKYDSRSVAALNNLGAVDCLDRKFKPAIAYLKKALSLDETSASTHVNLAEAWMGLGGTDHAMTEYARALELDADVLSSDREGVIAQISTPEQRARVSYMIAKAYAKRGNIEGALEYLRRAKDGLYPRLADVYTDQEFAGLWQDPRLAKIVKR